MSEPNVQQKIRVLVVDDDPALQQLIGLLLTNAGLEPVEALNAAAAARILRTEQPPPRLIILDMMLPDVSGLEFLKQMRAKAQFDELPVLILSALADPQQIREGLQAGADRYLTKPYLANNLVITVQDMLRKGRQRKP